METVRVNLHCHSDCSDGALSPESTAQRLVDAGVICAALTDHDSVAGLDRFRDVLRRHGIAVVDGVELTCHFEGEELHLLGLGIDPHQSELSAALAALRRRRIWRTQSIVAVIPPHAAEAGEQGPFGSVSVDAEGRIAAADAIARIHAARGCAILAHPSVLRRDPERLRPLLRSLREIGLDGMEAYYGPAGESTRTRLASMARDLGLLCSAGTDWHGEEDGGAGGYAIEMPSGAWGRLRGRLHSAAAAPTRGERRAATARRQRRRFALHIIVPALLAIALFVSAFYVLFLPAFETSLLDRKREMIRELAHAAWSLLADAERQVAAGHWTVAEAQTMAAERIVAMRYGRGNRDYFWIQDMHPRMVAHPYRPDLNGHDLSDYRDATGARIFVEFADVVRRRGEGYVDYVWQWPDDPRHQGLKESYVTGFAPWGWVIGTGLYVEDVRAEIAALERGVVHAAALIAVLVALLLVNVVRFSRRLELERDEAEMELRAANERYRTLVEAATAGTLLVLDGRCRHANTRLLAMLGYEAGDLELLGLSDLLPATPANREARGRLELALRASEATAAVAAELRRRDGSHVPCTVAITPIAASGRSGLVLQAQERATSGPPPAATGGVAASAAMAETAPAGIFRARVGGRCDILEANRIARRFLSVPGGSGGLRPLADLFREPREWEGFLASLLEDGSATRRIAVAGADGRMHVAGLKATLLRDAAREPLFIDGAIEDVTSLARREAERDALIERLQAALLPFRERDTMLPTAELASAASVDEVVQSCRRTPAALQALLASDAPARTVARLATVVCDAATERLVALAIEELGPAPAPFSFLALGSQARQEQTFAADQDNALVYVPVVGTEEATAAYFLELGRRVCAGLAQAGYPQCRGHVMARFAVWCRPLDDWKVHFRHWIDSAEPEELLQFAICFDFRSVAGEAALATALRQDVFAAVRAAPQFLPHFARHALLFRPPLMVLGRLLGGPSDQPSGTLDLKDAMVPLVAFARLYALRYGLEPVSTLDRVDAMVQAGCLQPSSRDELREAYDLLLRLRLRSQAQAMAAGLPPGNRLRLRRLTHAERARLRQAFTWVKAVQQRIRYDFLGGTE